MRGTPAPELEPEEHKRIITSLVTPRPIGWVSTVDEHGVDNLAPFSCYSYANMSPPVVQIRCSKRPSGERKDTARNALETGEFVVNLVTESLIEEMDQTAAPLPPAENEFDAVGLERAASVTIDSPRVKAAQAHMECTLYDHISVYDSDLFFGEVEYFHISENLMENGKVTMEKVATIGRLGGPYYTNADSIDFERQL